jgi:hypothetical protein
VPSVIVSLNLGIWISGMIGTGLVISDEWFHA